jgi:hypothetical protein
MKRRRQHVLSILALAGALTAPIACSDSGTIASIGGDGTSKLVVRLTDAPFSSDSVKSVDIFVVRVEGRVASATDDDANANLDNGGNAGWQVVATPNASFNLLALQNGVSTTLGEAPLPPGTYNGLRLIIDPGKSSVTLKNGQVLTNTSSPDVTFPSASRSGLKIVPSEPVKIVAGTTTTLLVDFDVNNSFVQRGNSIDKNGLLFKPVIKATITDAATVNATIRFANATATTLTLQQNGTALSGGSALAFGASSACSSVSATNPLLSLLPAGSTTILTGFAPTLQVGTSYTLLAYPGGVATQFATLSNTFTPTSGQGGLRVFNAAGSATGIDVYVTASGAPLTTATVSNALAGVASNFVSVPAGSSQVRLTSTGSTTVLLDFGAQSFTAGQNVTLVIAPPAAGSTTIRAFLVTGC